MSTSRKNTVSRVPAMRDGEYCISIRFSKEAYAAFERHRKIIGSSSENEISRGSLARYMIEQVLHVQGLLQHVKEMHPVGAKRTLASRLKERLEEAEREIRELRNRLESAPSTNAYSSRLELPVVDSGELFFR